MGAATQLTRTRTPTVRIATFEVAVRAFGTLAQEFSSRSHSLGHSFIVFADMYLPAHPAPA